MTRKLWCKVKNDETVDHYVSYFRWDGASFNSWHACVLEIHCFLHKHSMKNFELHCTYSKSRQASFKQ